MELHDMLKSQATCAVDIASLKGLVEVCVFAEEVVNRDI